MRLLYPWQGIELFVVGECLADRGFDGIGILVERYQLLEAGVVCHVLSGGEHQGELLVTDAGIDQAGARIEGLGRDDEMRIAKRQIDIAGDAG